MLQSPSLLNYSLTFPSSPFLLLHQNIYRTIITSLSFFLLDSEMADAGTSRSPVRPVLLVSAGASHSAALLSGNIVVSLGKGEDGQLGHGDAEDRYYPTQVSALHGLDIISVVCGADHTTAYSKTQLQVYSWGWGDFGRLGHGNSSDLFIPQPIQALQGMQIKQLACGDSHCLALSMDGDVWSWGRNQNGQLGLGTSEDSLVPQKIHAFQGVSIKMVAAGAEHTVAVSKDGELYGWGWGRYGNLGLGDRNDRLVPQKVDSSHGEKMTLVACGWRHTISVTSSGGLYTYGWSKYGHLGHGDFEDHLVPHNLKALRDYFITEISGGWRHTMAVTSDGTLFGWGWNKFGQVGVGDNADHCYPVQLKLPHEQKVVQISCGWRHTLAVTDRQNVFSWGRNTNGQLGHGEAIDRNIPKLIDVLSADGCGVRHLASSMEEPSSGKMILSVGERYAVVPGETGRGRQLTATDASTNDASVPQGDAKRTRI